jgi:hypothetical protein
MEDSLGRKGGFHSRERCRLGSVKMECNPKNSKKDFSQILQNIFTLKFTPELHFSLASLQIVGNFLKSPRLFTAQTIG